MQKNKRGRGVALMALSTIVACALAWSVQTESASARLAAGPSAQATPKPTVAATANAPRDKAGRRFGGNMPYLNYSPTMIAGKPCKRVAAFTLDAKGRASDPCVIQNALDDYMHGAYAEWNINSRAEILELVKAFATDAALAKAFSGIYVEIGVKQKGYERSLSLECDQPLYRLLVGADSAMRLYNEGGASKALIKFVRVSKDLQPYACKTRSFDGKQVKPLPPVTASDLSGARAAKIYQVELVFNPKLAAWQILGIKTTGDQYLSGVELGKLYTAAIYKP